METYQKTHPWLTFELNLSSAAWQLWLLAGEAISKTEHVSGVALGPEAARELMKVYLAKGALATTAIEGNTLTEEEARQRVDAYLAKHEPQEPGAEPPASSGLPPSKEYL